MTAKELIDKLDLQPHPEGGFYRETYRCKENMVTGNGQNRSISTAIYYLLEHNDKSCFHRIKSDEMWFYQQGQSLEILSINHGQLTIVVLGNDIEKGEVLHTVVPANTWFASGVKNEEGFCLVSCVVAPGFDFADFEMASQSDLLLSYPHLKEYIVRFT